MKYSFISRRFVSDSMYEAEQEGAPFIILMVLIFAFSCWIYTSYINPIIKTKNIQDKDVVYKIVNTSKNKIINDYIHFDRFQIDNIKIGDSVEILIETNYRKFGDSSVYAELK